MLLVRQDFRLDLADPELGRNRPRGGAIVSGQHDDTDAIRLKAFQRGECGRLDRIGDRDKSGSPAVNGDKHRGGAVAAKLIRLRLQFRSGDTKILQELGIANRHVTICDFAGDTFAGHRGELSDVLDD